METTDKPTTDKPTTFEAPAEEDAKPGKEDPKEEIKPSHTFEAKDEKPAEAPESDAKGSSDPPRIGVPIAVGVGALAVAGLAYAIVTWGVGIAIAMAIILGFVVFALIGWQHSRNHKKRQQNRSSRSSSGGSQNRSSGFSGSGSGKPKTGSKGSKTGSRNHGSKNHKTGSRGSGGGSGNRGSGSGSQRAGSTGGSGGGSRGGSRNRRTAPTTAKKTPGVNTSRARSGVGSRKPGSMQSAGSGGLFSKPTKQDFANDWKSIKKGAKKARKGGRKFWEAAYGSAPYVADGARRTGTGIKDAFLAVAPVKSDRKDDTGGSDDPGTLNDHAVQEAATPPIGGITNMSNSPIARLAHDVADIPRVYDLSTDANLYAAVDDMHLVIESVAAMADAIAARGAHENSKGTRQACELMHQLAKEVRDSGVDAHEIAALLHKDPEYIAFHERLEDPNGGASDTSQARRSGY